MPHEMAREEKKIELRPVEEEIVRKDEPVIRLESDDSSVRARPVRLSPSVEVDDSHRLDVPNRQDFETRTHQPGIEALIENGPANPDGLEQDWGKESAKHRSIPWGWFVLIGLILAGAAFWSLAGVKKADVKAAQIRVEAESVLVNEEKEDKEATALIERLDEVTRKFFSATTVEALIPLVRQPERVRPLMEQYYAKHPLVPVSTVRTTILQPLTLDNRANFWMKSVQLPENQTSNMIVEVLENGEPKIDWETLVCYQPMDWDSYVATRPAGQSLDFRVYVEPDNFFSHEFADAEKWYSFRLTTLNADETLFGYVPVGSEISEEIIELLKRNGGARTSMVLRLNIPQGLTSRRGVVIEKLMSPRWMYVNPPETNS
ncbi:MAG: hypothetical protein EOP88_19965 [Verrucomicrobiaceae bacterium]|nr:MAG: hypothetical protein EOP88_19965 [Verrucomicrobiaceae bacterium]